MSERLPPFRWSSYFFYEATYGISMMSMILGYGLRISGVRHVPKCGPALFIANHQSFFDPLLVGLAVRRHLSYLARKSLFRQRGFAWIIRMLNAVPIDQEGLGIEGLRTILALLHAGHAVVVFPEGERTHDGALHELQPGIQLLIKRAAAPIVPIAIAGAYDAWPRQRPFPLPEPLLLPPRSGGIAVAIGRPLDAEHYSKLPRPALLAELYGELQCRLAQAETLRRKSRW